MLRGHRALKGSKRGARNHTVHGPTHHIACCAPYWVRPRNSPRGACEESGEPKQKDYNWKRDAQQARSARQAFKQEHCYIRS